MKKCKYCNDFKPLENFRKNRQKCKECEANQALERYYKNQDAVKTYNREYKINNQIKIKKDKAEWKKTNKDKVISSVRKRQALQLGALPSWANIEDIKKVYYQASELENQDGIKRHVDHIIPLQNKYVCGLHIASNLQILTAFENLSKK